MIHVLLLGQTHLGKSTQCGSKETSGEQGPLRREKQVAAWQTSGTGHRLKPLWGRQAPDLIWWYSIRNSIALGGLHWAPGGPSACEEGNRLYLHDSNGGIDEDEQLCTFIPSQSQHSHRVFNLESSSPPKTKAKIFLSWC